MSNETNSDVANATHTLIMYIIHNTVKRADKCTSVLLYESTGKHAIVVRFLRFIYQSNRPIIIKFIRLMEKSFNLPNVINHDATIIAKIHAKKEKQFLHIYIHLYIIKFINIAFLSLYFARETSFLKL